MKLKFRHKVFLSFLLNSMVIVISMLMIGRYYASRNFEEYIGKVETERLNQLVNALSQKYQKTRNWNAIVNDRDHWVQWTAMGAGQSRGDVADGKQPFPPPPFSPRPPMARPPEVGGSSHLGSRFLLRLARLETLEPCRRASRSSMPKNVP